VQRDLMAELGLPCPDITWHTARDGIAELGCVLAICTSTLGKMAHEIYALQKTDVAELEEPFSPGKVGSSTMPHKRNPPTCETVVAIAKIVRSIAPLAIEAMLAEHERDKIGLQTEREFLSRACCLADAATRKMVIVMRDLTVRSDNMRANLWRQNGLLMSEPVMMALGATFGRQEAHEMVYEVCMQAFETGGSLKDGLLAHPTIGKHLTAKDIDAMLDPDGYTGDAAVMTDRVVAAARARLRANAQVMAARPLDDTP
jgi:3-carboxy-cis,cis-muconate cycloisomerase